MRAGGALDGLPVVGCIVAHLTLHSRVRAGGLVKWRVLAAMEAVLAHLAPKGRSVGESAGAAPRPPRTKKPAAALAFARTLPAHDILFLRRDITQPEAIDTWLSGIERGRITSVLAERNGIVQGYATVDRGELSWSPHVAELRVLVSAEMRGKGLGRCLHRRPSQLRSAWESRRSSRK